MNIYHHTPRRLMALLLALVLCIGMVPSAFAAQEDNYHDPAENWMEALNRTNELDANSVVKMCIRDRIFPHRDFHQKMQKPVFHAVIHPWKTGYLRSVSYTHLDVDKRQPLSCSFSSSLKPI